MTSIDACVSLTELVTEGNQYLTFQLQEEQYGVDILCVQEIKGYTRVTQLPIMPAFINGAMNLRGTVVPIIDLRGRLAMPAAKYDQFTVVIVVNVGTKVVGLVVDAVSDVLNIEAPDIEAAPDFGDGIDTSFIKGMAKHGQNLITLLEIEKLLELSPPTRKLACDDAPARRTSKHRHAAVPESVHRA